MVAACPVCGAALGPGETCTDLFNRMLAIEHGLPGVLGGETHLFSVGSYQMQHPDQLERRALLGIYRGLGDMLRGRIDLAEHRRRVRLLAEGPVRVVRREAPSAANPEERPWPSHWDMTVADAAATEPASYVAIVRRWAETTLAAIAAVRGEV